MTEPTTRHHLELEAGPCAFCDVHTPYEQNQRDEDGQYYCAHCCAVAEAEDTFDCYLAGYATYEQYLAVNAYTAHAPRPRKDK